MGAVCQTALKAESFAGSVCSSWPRYAPVVHHQELKFGLHQAPTALG